MRIARQSATELQLEDSGFTMLAFGILAVAAAIFCGGFAFQDGKLAAALVVLGGFGSAGIVMLRRAEAIVHHFDLQRGLLTVDTRPALASGDDDRRAVTYPLHTIADLVLEESSSTDSDGTRSHVFRPVYVFRDGTRLPLVQHYTSQRASQAGIQTAVRSALSGFVAKRA